MDKRKSILNVSASLASRVLLLVLGLFTRRLLIQCVGNDVNGLNSLYSSIIGMLSVAELGVGSAILFSMYRPIVDGDRCRVAALYHLYRKLYLVIGAVILVSGLLVMPFLPHFISDYETLSVNVYSTFLLALVSAVLSYLYGAKTSLIVAHKDDYVVTGITTIASLLGYVLQIVALLMLRSYVAFLACQIVQELTAWAFTNVTARKRHGNVLALHEHVDEPTMKEVKRNVRAMCMHKIGTVLVNTVDSIVISTFIGVVVLGRYANYVLVANVLAGTISLFFTPLTSVVGHLCAEGDYNRTRAAFDKLYCLNYALGVVSFLGYCAVVDDVVALCFGNGLEVPRVVCYVIALNQFCSFMRRTPLLFRVASGAFYDDRWKPVVEGVVNLALSMTFVNVFPEDLRVAGVLTATIITTLLICDVVEPYVVFKRAFGASPWTFCVRNYVYIALFALCAIGVMRLTKPYGGEVGGILANGLVSLTVSGIALGMLILVDRHFRQGLRELALGLVETIRTHGQPRT